MKFKYDLFSVCMTALLLAGGGVGTAMATPITSATSVYLTYRDCTTGGPCDSGIPVQRARDFAEAGASSASATNPTLGSSSASAAFGSTLGSPVLRALADSTADGRLGATSIAVQRYDNTGSSSSTVFFGGELTFSLTGVDPLSTYFSGLQARLAVFRTPDGFIDVDTTSDAAAFFDLFLWSDIPGVTTLYDSGYQQFTTSTTPSTPIPLTTPGITSAPGESFFVYAELLAIGAEGATADASSTLVTNFYDTNDVQNRVVLDESSGLAAVTGIPVVSSLALLLSGMCGLLWQTRYGRTRRFKA